MANGKLGFRFLWGRVSAVLLATVLFVVLFPSVCLTGCKEGGAGSAVTATGTRGPATPITLSLVASRTSGVAPLAVFFDATGTTATATTRPFHDLEYRWNFGDTPLGSATWSTGSRSGVSKRNEATGPVAAHVFETPGTYTITLSIFDGTNTVSNNSVQITVQDPSVVFAGTKTICFSKTGDFTSCPAGAQTVIDSAGDFTSAITNLATGKRLLFCGGETWTAATQAVLAKDGPWTIGSYGGGTTKIQATANNTILLVSTDTTPGLKDGRIMDLDLDGLGGNAVKGIEGGGGMNQVTLLRLSAHDMWVGVLLSDTLLDAWNNSATPSRHGHSIWSQWAIVDSSIFGSSPSSGGYDVYASGDYVAVLGNSFVIDNTNSHNTRFTYLGKSVISNNTYTKPGSTLTSTNIKLHAPSWRNLPSAVTAKPIGVEGSGVGNGFSRWVVISDNKITGGANQWYVSIGPQDEQHDERVRDVIGERNWIVAGSGFQTGFHIAASEVTLRSNVFDTSLGSDTQNVIAIAVRGIELPSDPNPASDVRVYNETIYSAKAIPATQFFSVNIESIAVSNITIKNNLGYAPNVTGGTPQMIGDPGASNVITSNNSTNSQLLSTNPNFASVALFTPANAKPLAGYAIGAGTVVPAWSDFFLLPQPALRDLGAVVH